MRNNDDHARQASYTPPGLIGTNTTPPAERRRIRPFASFSISTNFWFYPRPTGTTRRPPFASWSMSAGGTSGGAAVTMIPLNGACSGQPL